MSLQPIIYPSIINEIMAHISTTSSPPVAEGTMDANTGYRPPPGYLGNLSIPQQHALEKLKKELEVAEEEEEWFVFDKERLDDLTLLRYVVSTSRKRKILILCFRKIFESEKV